MKKFNLNGFTGFIHELHDKTTYAIRCDIKTIDKLINTLNEKFNSVTVYEQKTIMPMPITYYEIYCK